MLGEFSFIGKDTVVMFPGRKSTTGGMPPVTGVAARDITLADMLTIQRTVAGIESIAPLVVGNAPVSHGSLERDSTVIGTSADFFAVRQLRIAQGSMLPALALDIGTPVAVIGQKLKQELFGNRRAIGQWVRLRDYRFRVIGVLEGRGDSFGTDLSEAIFIPVASAQAVFNTNGLFRVVLKAREGVAIAPLKEELLERMKQLHEGEEDVTVTSPDAMISTFDGVLRVLTLGVSGIAAISLVVAGILVMNLTLMSVSQRTPEIGLLKALGATDRQVRAIFLAEAGLLASRRRARGPADRARRHRADRGALPRDSLQPADLGAGQRQRTRGRDRATVRLAAGRQGGAARTRAGARQALSPCSCSTGPAGSCAR